MKERQRLGFGLMKILLGVHINAIEIKIAKNIGLPINKAQFPLDDIEQ